MYLNSSKYCTGQKFKYWRVFFFQVLKLRLGAYCHRNCTIRWMCVLRMCSMHSWASEKEGPWFPQVSQLCSGTCIPASQRQFRPCQGLFCIEGWIRKWNSLKLSLTDRSPCTAKIFGRNDGWLECHTCRDTLEQEFLPLWICHPRTFGILQSKVIRI